MTRNSTFSKIKNRSAWILAVICLLCFSLFFFVGCGNTSDSDSDETTYTKTEQDLGDITNSTFEFGSVSLDLEDYPQTSPSGWTKSVDNSAKSVSTKSGIISVDAWTEVLKNLYDNSDFLSYAKNQFGFDDDTIDDIKEAIKTEDSDLSDDEVNEKVKEKIITDYIANSAKEGAFEVPTAKDGKKLYMLNNYTSGLYGSAQKLTSSSTVSLEKDSNYQISVWVKTHNLSYIEGSKGGANIRLINNFNGTAQAPFGIYGIDTKGNWANYKLFIKTDKNYDCSVQLVLGLGLGNGNTAIVRDYTEGTVFFDNISIEKVENALPTFETENQKVFNYERSSEDTNFVKANGENYFYNMSLSEAITNYTTSDFSKTFTLNYTYDFTIREGRTSESILGAGNSEKGTATPVSNGIEITGIKNASTTLTFENAIKVSGKSYSYLSFTIKNDLSKFDKSGISVYAIDKNKNEGYANTTTLVTTFTTVGEDTLCSILFKNDFNYERTADLVIVIGPSNIKDLKNADDFASAKDASLVCVGLYDFKLYGGSIYQYINDDPVVGKETDNYDYYSLFSATATSTINLTAGDTSKAEDADPVYNFSVASTELNKIEATTVKVKNYKGVIADSQYISSESNKTVVDGRVGTVGDENGNAGLINTKYLNNYSLYVKSATDGQPNIASINGSDIATALDYKGEDPIQPLMIYNKNASAYGFFGNTLNVSASSYAKISVRVRVVDSAVAYVYLVDVSGENKDVLTLDTFKVNTDGYNYKTTDTVIENKQLSFEVNSSMMEKDGWCTVSFYIATGATAKSFRLEMWNGGRDGQSNSTGFVFFDLPTNAISTSSAFSEPASWSDMYSTGSVLAGLRDDVIFSAKHQQELDSVEIKFNSEQTDSKKLVSYDAKYIWIEGKTFKYAVYNTIDPVAVDPYSVETEEETTTSTGCTAESDPSTFWLSFSSILLGAVLVLAIVMLFIKNYKRRHKRDAKDAKSHYNVKSRYNAKKPVAKKVKVQTFDDYEEEVNEKEVEPEITEEPVEEVVEENNDYIYGEVQNFGEEETEVTSEENENN